MGFLWQEFVLAPVKLGSSGPGKLYFVRRVALGYIKMMDMNIDAIGCATGGVPDAMATLE